MARDPSEWGAVSRELSAKAKRDNPGVTLRPGTVLSVTSGGTITCGVHVDGDETGTITHATSVIGGLSVGERVMVTFTPPRGVLVTSRIMAASIEGRCVPQEVDMGLSGLLEGMVLPTWRSNHNRTLVRVVGLLVVPGSTSVTVDFTADGAVQGTLTIAAGSLDGEVTGLNVSFLADSTILGAEITGTGTDAQTLTIIFYLECGLQAPPAPDDGGGGG